MTVVFDTNLAIMLVRPDAMVAKDARGVVISHAKERVDGLLAQLAADKGRHPHAGAGRDARSQR